MCGATKRMKRLALPVLASVALAPRPNKLSRNTAEAKMKPPPPQDLSDGPYHLSGIVVEITEMEWGGQGRTCEEHLIYCGEVLGRCAPSHGSNFGRGEGRDRDCRRVDQ